MHCGTCAALQASSRCEDWCCLSAASRTSSSPPTKPVQLQPMCCSLCSAAHINLKTVLFWRRCSLVLQLTAKVAGSPFPTPRCFVEEGTASHTLRSFRLAGDRRAWQQRRTQQNWLQHYSRLSLKVYNICVLADLVDSRYLRVHCRVRYMLPELYTGVATSERSE